MATIIAALTAIGSQIATAAGTAGAFAAANAGTIGTVLSTAGTIYGGVKAVQSGNAEAKSLKKKGDEEFAIGQSKARRSRQEKDLLLSRQRAVAASGGGGLDGSTEAIMKRTEIEGNNNALMDMYNAATMRDDLYHEGAVAKSEGQSKLFGSVIDAGAGIYSDLAKKSRFKKESYEAAYG